MGDQVESAVDDVDSLLLTQVQETPVFYDQQLATFVNMPAAWKHQLQELNLNASEEETNAKDILGALKFLQTCRANKNKFLIDENNQQVTFDGDEPDYKVVERVVQSRHMTSQEFVSSMQKLVSVDDAASKYKLFHPVGKGATAIVYHGVNNHSHQDVAVKEMTVSALTRKDLVHEEIAMMKMIKHDNIVNYLESFLLHNNSTLWIVMEYLDGGSLSNVAFYTLLHEFQVAHIMKQCLQGLSYLHANKIIHRDVKSDNVLLGFNGSVKLTDFGFCAKLDHSSELRHSYVGTLYWMAPEVVKEKPYNSKIDVWSLGIMLVEMIDGSPPYMGESEFKTIYLISSGRRPPVKDVHRFSRDASTFLDCCLQSDVAKRSWTRDLLRHAFITKERFQGFEIKDNILFARQKHRDLTVKK